MKKGCRFGCVLLSLTGARLIPIMTNNVDTKRFTKIVFQVSRTNHIVKFLKEPLKDFKLLR